MTLPAIGTLRHLLRQTAREELLPRFGRTGYRHKRDGSLVTDADEAVQRRLRESLAARWPEYGFLGEEMTVREQTRLLDAAAGPKSAGGLWCVDPLDGTTNFAHGVPFFAVSLALIRAGRVELGLVYDPCRDECFSAGRGQGAWLDDARLGQDAFSPALAEAVALVDFKRLPGALARRLASEAPYRSQRNFGTVALDWCWTAAGRGHVYLHGAQSLWDYAAGWLVLNEAGGQCATLDGEPVFQPALATRSVSAALAPHLFEEWTQWIGIDVHQPPGPARARCP
ncbi:MAG TPA: inositol monophosphatase family protein [Gammaproteobacteria bacterium]|nr:inositol monophosphatase family protein [Gammaproteobacteria bacterium]